MEEDTARSTDTSAVYWRFEDPLCQHVLLAGEGNQPRFVGTFFPFYRKASVLGLPRIDEFLPHWLLLAFSAGQAYGQSYPTEAEALLEEYRAQSQAAWDLLAALRRRLERTGVGYNRLASALTQCCAQHENTSGQPAIQRIITHSRNAMWGGLFAATRASNDVLQSEFLELVRQAINPSRLPLHFSALINAPLDAHNHSTLDLLLHPLLDVASEKYVPTPLEGHAILRYVNKELRGFARKREDDCPASDRDLVRWVAGAMNYARTLADADDGLLARVFTETGQSHLRVVLRILHEVLAGIEEKSPSNMANRIVRWHKEYFGWSKPSYYGQALERIVHSVDMAIWLAWEPELGDFPDVSSKRGMSM